MRRCVAILMVVCLWASLAGCGQPRVNKDLSEDAVAALTAAIETLDSFLKYDLTADEAASKLERIGNSLSGSDDFHDGTAVSFIKSAAIKVSCYGIEEGINQRGVISVKQDMSSIRDDRNDLYDYLYRK